jgi:hypothetical protein
LRAEFSSHEGELIGGEIKKEPGNGKWEMGEWKQRGKVLQRRVEFIDCSNAIVAGEARSPSENQRIETI